MRGEPEVRVVDPQLTALRIERDLEETTNVRRDFAAREDAQLVGEHYSAVLRAGLCLLRTRVRCLNHQGHRRDQVQEEALLALRVFPLE